MSPFTLAAACAVCAAIPALLFWRNLGRYAPPPAPAGRPAVSVLIPARDEEGSIRGAVEAALASRGVELEVVVLDDHSRDRTAEIVRSFADPRVRLETAPPLPAGWCGKQHACAALARLARHPLLLFVDADVRLEPDGAARAAAFLERSGAGLVSGVPRQETVTFLERLLLPLIHFVLLGFLPMGWMRRFRHPAFGAGCGQLFLARRDAYAKAGGHAAPGVRASLHDGITLPRAFREAGIATDLFDATEVASCRMYRGADEVWRGLSKNATEGIAAPGKIVPFTLLLGAGQVMPPVLLALALAGALPSEALLPSALGSLAGWLPRLAAVRRFRQPLDAALLHPLAILVFLVLQWNALGRKLLGRPSGWKGRSYRPSPAP